MDEGDPFESMGFNPSEFFQQIKRSASIKAGAILFGQAQTAYWKALKEGGMDDEAAYALTAHTTEYLIQGIASAVGPVSEVMLKLAAMSEYFDTIKPKSDKQVPGE
jgi:hypothetical protein